MNTLVKVLGVTGLLGLSSAVGAATVGGVTWVPNDFTEMDSGAFAQDFNAITGELTGWGVVTSFNNDVVTDMCLGCELTYSFNGFVLDEANSSLNRLRFLGGTVNFFTDIPGDFLIGDQATAQNGTHWLSIEGHEFLDVLNTPPLTNVTLTANLTGGHLMFDTLSGPAAEFFDTNSIPDFLGGFADFEVNSSVVSYYSNGIAGDSTGNNDISSSAFAADVLLTAIGLGIDPNDIGVDVGAFFIDHMGLNNVASTGSLDMRGQSVPEPTVLYLMGLGLLGFGAVRNRKNA